MAKRHIPRRYQKKEAPVAELSLSGNIFLKHEDAAAIAAAKIGDVYLYLHFERADRGDIEPDYHSSGHAGQLKAMVCAKRGWKPLLVDEFFPDREHHFSKKERPWDRFLLCKELLQQYAGTKLRRSYREHYEPLPADAAEGE